jgi:very-short-patch-repair endonuclease
LAGLKFVRQAPVQPYIVDFLCRDKKLVVELDGESHVERGGYDLRREEFLPALRFNILRIPNDELMRDIESVLAAIVQAAGLDVVAWSEGRLGRYE